MLLPVAAREPSGSDDAAMTSKAFGHRMASAPWREKSAWAAIQGRNVERIAEGVRRGLLDFALDGIGPDDLLATIRGLRSQLDVIERQVEAVQAARQASDP